MPNVLKLLILLFVARVSVPMGERRTYPNVTEVVVVGDAYKLTLSDNSTVWVPVQFTVIEERR